jgi:hypothetical protein
MMDIKGLLTPSNGDLQVLRILIAVAAVLGVAGAVLGFSGFSWSAEPGGESGWIGGFDFSQEPEGIVVDLAPEEYENEIGNPSVLVTAIRATVPLEGAAQVMERIGSFLTGIGIGSALAVAFVVLTRATKGRLFEPSSAKLLVLAAMTMVIAQIGEVVNSLARMEALADLGLTPATGLSFGYAILALVFGALARAWQVGSDLAEDNALTV